MRAVERAVFPPGHQAAFLDEARCQFEGTHEEFAILCGVHPRTLCDWQREKYTMDTRAVANLQRRLHVEPGAIRLVNPYRHVRAAGARGARARYRLYGNPGTPEGRRKGGRATQRLFQANPEQAAREGFLVRKAIQKPSPSSDLAEFVGILLGDGSVSRYQVSVYLNEREEREFAAYVRSLVQRLFGVTAIFVKNARHCLAVVASSRNLVEFLQTIGLELGDKISNSADVPSWIFERTDYQAACLRGLVDTDGTIFWHSHVVCHRRYRNLGLAFTSYSPLLLRSTYRLLVSLGFRAKIYPRDGHVFLFRRDDVKRYMMEVGTRNLHRRRQFERHLERCESG